MSTELARQRAARLLVEAFETCFGGALAELDIIEVDEDDGDPYAISEVDREAAVAELLVMVRDLERAAGAEPARRCRRCGCTDANGCEEGCSWVAEDLCSACTPIAPAAAADPARRRTP